MTRPMPTHAFALAPVWRFAAMACLLAAGSVQAASVQATADLFNAAEPGNYDGTNPVAIDVTGLTSLTFSVSGGPISYNSGGNYNDADGIGSASDVGSSGTAYISGLSAPHAGFLSGVFLPALPVASAPTALDFNAIGTSFTSLSPVLQQSFFIGDGLTGDGTGSVQTFVVPSGATTLYLGFVDACGYHGGPSCYGDNLGSFDVTANGVAAVPEPGPLALLSAGLMGVAWRLRRRLQD